MTSSSPIHMLYMVFFALSGLFLASLIPTTPFLDTVIVKNISYHFVLNLVGMVITSFLGFLFERWLRDKGIYL